MARRLSLRLYSRPSRLHARDFEIPETVAGYILRAQEILTKDPASQRLLFPGGKPLTAGALFRNPELADVLETLAEANSVEPFYRGGIGEKIAQAFQDNGGILTTSDMEEYAASEVEPVHLEWRGYDIYTAPLTAGGATSLEAVNILKALGWGKPQQRRRAEPRSA